MQKELYRERKRKHICVKCGKEEAYGNGVCCLVCKMDMREYNQKYYRQRDGERRKQAAHERYKKLRQRRIEAGVCLSCGKRPPVEGKRLCVYCNAKQRRQQNAYRKRTKKPHGDGVCLQCYEPVVLGYKLCAKHLQNAREASKKGTEALREKRRQERDER